MRIGVAILPTQPWSAQRRKWEIVEELGFDSAWTYDHLSWRDFAGGPWFSSLPTLTAAATATEKLTLGTLVASPNFRHPITFAQEVMTLDHISNGRLLLGVGSGGTGWDATVFGEDILDAPTRMRRFTEFVDGIDVLLTQPTADLAGEFYKAVNARTVPGCVQQPRVPFGIAANGPRAMELAVRQGSTWITIGPMMESFDEKSWWQALVALNEKYDNVRAGLPETQRYVPDSELRRLILPESTGLPIEVATFAETLSRFNDLGFTDVVIHWPESLDPDVASFGLREREQTAELAELAQVALAAR